MGEVGDKAQGTGGGGVSYCIACMSLFWDRALLYSCTPLGLGLLSAGIAGVDHSAHLQEGMCQCHPHRLSVGCDHSTSSPAPMGRAVARPFLLYTAQMLQGCVRKPVPFRLGIPWVFQYSVGPAWWAFLDTSLWPSWYFSLVWLKKKKKNVSREVVFV